MTDLVAAQTGTRAKVLSGLCHAIRLSAAAVAAAFQIGPLLVSSAGLSSSGLAASQTAAGSPELQGAALLEFERGARLFTRSWTLAEGLGPSYSATSCAECHSSPAAGGASSGAAQFGVVAAQEAAAPAPFATLQQSRGGKVEARPIPAAARRTRAPSLFGLGLLSTIDASAVFRLEDPLDRDGNGISGRASRVEGTLGWLGWKASVGSIEAFVRVALRSELGLVPEAVAQEGDRRDVAYELASEDVERLSRFIRGLAAPQPKWHDAVGARVFNELGCHNCHVPTIDGNTPYAYTDLLLHDMGPDLADPFSGGAQPSEFRTAPLWGLSVAGRSFLHDGRAHSVEDAILRHGGEGLRSRNAFSRLPALSRRQLMHFLAGL
jgi:CxxC motif-containing protein (DUF1111 family)